jgi:hypothetical protein
LQISDQEQLTNLYQQRPQAQGGVPATNADVNGQLAERTRRDPCTIMPVPLLKCGSCAEYFAYLSQLPNALRRLRGPQHLSLQRRFSERYRRLAHAIVRPGDHDGVRALITSPSNGGADRFSV